MPIEFTFLQTPLNRYTFKSKKIKEWVENHVEGYVLNLFAGEVKLNCYELRNDININMPAHYHRDALEFCKFYIGVNGIKFNTILLDPPYSYRKSMEMYEGRVMSPFNALKDEICKIISPNGIVITFGYCSVSMGKKRGFNVEHILIMSHGGAIHDTIATIERLTF